MQQLWGLHEKNVDGNPLKVFGKKYVYISIYVCVCVFIHIYSPPTIIHQ